MASSSCRTWANSCSSRIGVFTGSVIILVIALAFVRWIGSSRTTELLMVGVLWLILTLAFEILFGRFVVGASWERLAAGCNVPEGGLLPLGCWVLMLSPLIGGGDCGDQTGVDGHRRRCSQGPVRAVRTVVPVW